MKLFSVLDIKADYFLTPTVQPSTANALRSFEVTANQAGTTINLFPDDFCLMELGSFDPKSGAITVLPTPLNLGSARSLVRSSPIQATVSQ